MRMKMLFVLLFFCVVGCKRSVSKRGKGKLYVVATTGMLADAVKQVGGPWVEVDGLMGPSVDPHLYKATASDTRKLAEASLIVYNGLHLEGKMQNILMKMSKGKAVVAATDGISRKKLLKPVGYQGAYDPHVWFDVGMWQRVVTQIAKALSKADSKHKLNYQRNAAAYNKKLAALDAWARLQLSQIPRGRRYLVTSHDAFGYFGKAYGLHVVGLQGVSTVTEAGLRDIERVIRLLVEKKIPAIFAETSVSDSSVKAVIERCAKRKHRVSMGGKLYSDAMGAAGTPEGSYIGMVKFNVRTVRKALLGVVKRKKPQAPPAPPAVRN